jgi:MFS family permease
MERFGIRRTVSFSLATLGVGVALTSVMRAPWQLIFLWGILVGTGSGMIALVLGATVAERWFVRGRGLVLGILTASNATGQLIFLPFLAKLVVNFGWRAVSLTVALITLLIAPIAALVLRNRPSDIGRVFREPRPGTTRWLFFRPGCSVLWQRFSPLLLNQDQGAVCRLSQCLRARRNGSTRIAHQQVEGRNLGLSSFLTRPRL